MPTPVYIVFREHPTGRVDAICRSYPEQSLKSYTDLNGVRWSYDILFTSESWDEAKAALRDAKA